MPDSNVRFQHTRIRVVDQSPWCPGGWTVNIRGRDGSGGECGRFRPVVALHQMTGPEFVITPLNPLVKEGEGGWPDEVFALIPGPLRYRIGSEADHSRCANRCEPAADRRRDIGNGWLPFCQFANSTP